MVVGRHRADLCEPHLQTTRRRADRRLRVADVGGVGATGPRAASATLDRRRRTGGGVPRRVGGGRPFRPGGGAAGFRLGPRHRCRGRNTNRAAVRRLAWMPTSITLGSAAAATGARKVPWAPLRFARPWRPRTGHRTGTTVPAGFSRGQAATLRRPARRTRPLPRCPRAAGRPRPTRTGHFLEARMKGGARFGAGPRSGSGPRPSGPSIDAAAPLSVRRVSGPGSRRAGVAPVGAREPQPAAPLLLLQRVFPAPIPARRRRTRRGPGRTARGITSGRSGRPARGSSAPEKL